MKGKILFLTLVVILVLVSGCTKTSPVPVKTEPTSVCGNNIVEEGETSDNCCIDTGCTAHLSCENNKCQECVGEGGSVNTLPSPGGEIIGSRCCEGLTQITPTIKSGEEWITQTDGALCTKCGDGSCKKPENSENCPEDCPAYILHEWGVLLRNSARTTPLISPRIVAMKPIIYLYANESFNLSLSVDFENGEAVEVWPDIPTSKKISWNDFKVSQDCKTTPFPESRGNMKEIYELGKYIVDDANCITYRNVTSKILFYNGKIDFGNIITGNYIDLGNKKHITLTNNLEQDLSDIYVNYKQQRSYDTNMNVTLGSIRIDKLKAGETKTLDIEVNTFPHSNIPDSWENQGKEFKQSLIDSGLYTDEASKFMLAWEDTFFGMQSRQDFNVDYRNGMNIIFILPEKKYSDLFKLETSIEPQEIKRVGVVFSSIEESAPTGAASGTTSASAVIEENCDSYTSQIKSYCNPFSSAYNEESCSKAENGYEGLDCCNS